MPRLTDEQSSHAEGSGPTTQAEAYENAARLIRGAQRFLVTTHRDPDGDALGAEAAMAEALRAMGKEATVVNSDPVPPQYRFLAVAQTFEPYDDERHRALAAGADVVVLVDAAVPERTGRVARALEGYSGLSLVIDHHGHAGGWATVDLIDPAACAAVELVHDLLLRLPAALTPSMAEALYTGLVTDTQRFATSGTGPDVHRRAARLLEAGADAARVHQALSATWSLGKLRLLGDFFGGLRAAAAGQLVWGALNADDLARRACTQEDVEGFVDQALTVAGSRVAVLLVEQAGGDVKVSLRARPGVRVDGLARALGGGGHPLAAGALVSAVQAEALRAALSRADSVAGLGIAGEAAEEADDPGVASTP